MLKKRKKGWKPGLSPGSLSPPGKVVEQVGLYLVDYTLDEIEERGLDRIEDAFPYFSSPSRTWLDIVGLHEIELLEKLGQNCGFHILSLEDTLNTWQRAKFEDYDDYLYFVLEHYQLKEQLERQQVSLFLGSNFVITLRESQSDVFEPVLDRLRKGKGRIRSAGTDYLTYALIDILLDHMFPVVETYGERVEELEDELMLKPEPTRLDEVQAIKKEILRLRRSAWQVRELITGLDRSETELISEDNHVFFRDCYDHTVQLIEMIEIQRDLSAGLTELYLSSVSHRSNEVVKLLTVIASIFIPLTFLAGIYGMNFNTQASPYNMPELDWYLGYPTFWLVILVITGCMLVYFKRKKWI